MSAHAMVKGSQLAHTGLQELELNDMAVLELK